ncbi:MAG: hypothetical protein ACJ8LN_04165 [Sulfurifustis sp.]
MKDREKWLDSRTRPEPGNVIVEMDRARLLVAEWLEAERKGSALLLIKIDEAAGVSRAEACSALPVATHTTALSQLSCATRGADRLRHSVDETNRAPQRLQLGTM